MSAFFIFLLLIILIIFIAFSLISSILGGILNFFGLGSKKHGYFSNQKSSENKSQRHTYSEESAKRMRKFKNSAEDIGFEVIED